MRRLRGPQKCTARAGQKSPRRGRVARGARARTRRARREGRGPGGEAEGAAAPAPARQGARGGRARPPGPAPGRRAASAPPAAPAGSGTRPGGTWSRGPFGRAGPGHVGRPAVPRPRPPPAAPGRCARTTPRPERGPARNAPGRRAADGRRGGGLPPGGERGAVDKPRSTTRSTTRSTARSTTRSTPRSTKRPRFSSSLPEAFSLGRETGAPPAPRFFFLFFFPFFLARCFAAEGGIRWGRKSGGNRWEPSVSSVTPRGDHNPPREPPPQRGVTRETL